MNRYLFFFCSLLVASCLFFDCKSSKPTAIDFSKNYRIGFYNVENLFDTLDNPDKLDDDFTPSGRLEWNTKRYFNKLENLDKVVAGMGYPTLLGLCEVENQAVLQDFSSKTGLAKHNYGIVHYESPDKRGIDCALLYQKKYFEVLASDKIRIEFPEEVEKDYTSRDIIYTKGLFLNNFTVHIFVNHWPSRRGGLKNSEPKRLLVAEHLKKAVDKIFAEDPNANIVILGDMNDEPDNNSVLNTLNATALEDQPIQARLYNCMAKLDQQNKGTYNYRGNWNLLDNIITSANLVDPKSKINVLKPTIYREAWMMYENPKYGATPNRTYGGPNYYGGYSDHLPVYIDIQINR